MPLSTHHRRKRAFGLFLLLAAPLNLHAQGTQESAAPQSGLHVSTNLVYLWVNVTDSRGRFVPGLHRSDFEILDDGVAQPAVDFASDEEPAHVALLIEKGTVDTLFEILNRSPLADANVLVGELPPQDYVAILTYSVRPSLVSDFTADKTVTALALQQMEAPPGNGRGTGRPVVTSGALDLSASVAATVNWLSKARGSKTIVLFSTGFDATPLELRERCIVRLLLPTYACLRYPHSAIFACR